MSNEPDDLTRRQAALTRVIEAGEGLARVLRALLKRRGPSSRMLLHAEEDRRRAAHRAAWLEEAVSRGVPAAIAELQWRDLLDRSVPLTATERAELARWGAARQTEIEELRRSHERTLAVLERVSDQEES